MPSPIIRGLSTITWGTFNSASTPAGAVIESVKITPKNGGPIEIEDGNGFTISQILLDDGFDAAPSMLYDTAKTWPNTGDAVTVNIPQWGAAGGGTKSYNCTVVAPPEVVLGRKKEATISYKLTY